MSGVNRFPNDINLCLHNLFILDKCDDCSMVKIDNLDPVTGTDPDGYDSILTVSKKLTPKQRLSAKAILQDTINKAQNFDQQTAVTNATTQLAKIPE